MPVVTMQIQGVSQNKNTRVIPTSVKRTAKMIARADIPVFRNECNFAQRGRLCHTCTVSSLRLFTLSIKLQFVKTW